MPASEENDLVGERGEDLFRVAITRWCNGEHWFQVTYQGEKAEALDFQGAMHRVARYSVRGCAVLPGVQIAKDAWTPSIIGLKSSPMLALVMITRICASRNR